MLRQNGTANNKSYLLDAMLGSTNSNYACAVPRETKCEHATLLVPLEQSAIETIQILSDFWHTNLILYYKKNKIFLYWHSS